MTIWTAYIERDGKKYFIASGTAIEIMAMVYRRIADLKFPDSTIGEVDYKKVSVIPFNWGFIEELIQKSQENKSRTEARKIMRKLHPRMLRTESVHHKDLNPFNNNLDNLVIMDKWEHQGLHQKLRQSAIAQIEAEKFIEKCGL